MRDLPFGLSPNLGTSRCEVAGRIIRVGELIQYQPLSSRLHGQGKIPSAFHALLCGYVNQFRAIRSHGAFALLTLVNRHDELQAIAFCRRGHRQRNACIAAGGLDQGIPGNDRTTGLGLANHAHSRTILDRASRVIALKLAKDDIARLADNALQAHQWRLAH